MIISKRITLNNINIKSIIIKNIEINNFEYIIFNIGFRDVFVIYKEELIIKNKSFNELNILKIDFFDYFDLSNFNNIFPSNKLVYHKLIISISLKKVSDIEIELDKYLENKNIEELFSLINIPLTFYARIEYLINKKSSKIIIDLKENNIYLIISKNNILKNILVKPYNLFEIEEIKNTDDNYKYYNIKIDDKCKEMILSGLFEEGKIVILYQKNVIYEIFNGMGKLYKDNNIVVQNLENYPIFNITKKTIIKEKFIKNYDFLISKYI
jgi:hypothetical protein